MSLSANGLACALDVRAFQFGGEAAPSLRPYGRRDGRAGGPAQRLDGARSRPRLRNDGADPVYAKQLSDQERLAKRSGPDSGPTVFRWFSQPCETLTYTAPQKR